MVDFHVRASLTVIISVQALHEDHHVFMHGQMNLSKAMQAIVRIGQPIHIIIPDLL